jgi:hypothetical protein
MPESALSVSQTRERIFPTGLPILVGLREEILRALAIIWGVLIVGFITLRWEWAFAVGVWATVTTIMLWPVGKRLGRAYTSYRTIWFVLGVLSMAYIPFAGIVLQSDLSFDVKSAIWFGLPIDLTVFAIIPSFRFAIGKPIRMFFRPDLIFGDGRILCCGIVAVVLGMRYIIGSPPMGAPWPIPKWNWWAITFAMVVGFIPMIPLRGMTKLLMRLGRLGFNRWRGWGAVIVRETFLVVTALAIGYGFHNAFLGATPFTIPINTAHPDFIPALLITFAGALWIILARGWYKRHVIGDPFIRETPGQTLVKSVLLVVGLVVLFYGFMSILHMDTMHINAGVGGLRRPSNWAGLWWIGGPFFLWGAIVLTLFRVLGQIAQRRALVEQMATVILPAQAPEVRHAVLLNMMEGLADCPAAQREDYMRVMQAALSAAPQEVRAMMTTLRMECLAELPGEKRRTLMQTMDAVMAGG